MHRRARVANAVAGSRVAAILVAGDLAAFLIFAAGGREVHGLGATAAGAAVTALPFAAAWMLVGALVTGAYRGDALRSPGRAARRAVATWALAGPAGVAGRALLLWRVPHWSFAAVSLAATLVLLVGWRVLAAAIWGRRVPADSA